MTLNKQKDSRTIYAALARVSSEASERHGESLKLQKNYITYSVKALGGDPERDIIWDFCGQEHTVTDMASRERKLLKALLDEIEGGHCRFHAVMVQYIDRIGRNRETFDHFLKTLYDNDIDLYEGTRLIDQDDARDRKRLHGDKEDAVGLGDTALEKTMSNKIALATDGRYVQGKLYGRYRDEKDPMKWHVIPEIRKKLEGAAVALDKGESPRVVATKIGMDWRWLYKVLRHKAGSEIKGSLGTEKYKKWSRKRGNAFEYTFKTEPIVRDEALLKRVVARFDKNAQKYNNRAPQEIRTEGRVDFALQGLVRCGHCGYTMPPQKVPHKRVPEAQLKRKRKRLCNPEGINYYYRHASWDGCYKAYREKYPKGSKRGKGAITFPLTVATKRLEYAALAALFVEMDTKEVLTKALDASNRENGKQQRVLEKKLQKFRERQGDLQKRKTRLVKLAEEGLQNDLYIARTIKGLNDQLAGVAVDIDSVEMELRLIETPATIQEKAETVRAALLATERKVSEKRKGSSRPSRERMEEQIEWERKRIWASLTEPDPETGKVPSVRERAEVRARMLTNAQRRSIIVNLLEAPGCGVFVFKGKGGKLTGEIRTSAYPPIKFDI